jgi:hypothetical protein
MCRGGLVHASVRFVASSGFHDTMRWGVWFFFSLAVKAPEFNIFLLMGKRMHRRFLFQLYGHL